MKEKLKILIVDDEEIVRESLSAWLIEDGYDVHAVESGKKALEEIKTNSYEIMLIDLKMPEMDGLQLMQEVKKVNPDIIMIIITAYATVDTAVKAMKEGAYDYLVKPFDPDELSLVIKKISQHIRLSRENILLRKQLLKEYYLHDIISKNPKMLELFEVVRTVAPTDSTVLIQGESGTGKELFARAIHKESKRRDKPFVTLSCAALTETLLESELFGYEKGAFTGADSQRKGKLELADGGTLFLDEIGDIGPKLQLDLLRVLEEKEFRRVGGVEVIKVDVRIIAATNRDLKERVRVGKFREDLFYRLNVIPIYIPPLRERKEDIPLLVEHFIGLFNVEMGKSVKGVSEEAMRFLMEYDYPGNVRELKNIVERAMVLAKGDIITVDEISFFEKSHLPLTAGERLEDVERNHIIFMLEKYGWNIQKTASALGIDRTTLYNKMKKYGIEKPGVKSSFLMDDGE